MSCSGNQTTATTDFASATFASGVTPIEALAQAELTNNQATLSVTKGVVTVPLTFANSIFPTKVNGTGKFYLKIDPQTSGVNSSPPVTGDSTYRRDSSQTITLNTTFTSSTYAGSVTPVFDTSQTCGDTTVWGWLMNDAQVVMTRTNILTAKATFS